MRYIGDAWLAGFHGLITIQSGNLNARSCFSETEDHITSRRERIARWLAVVIVVSLFVGFVILSFPARENDLDFVEFYSAAQIVREGLGRDLYNLRMQVEFQSKIAAVHVFYNHPPFEALIFVPLTFFNYNFAYTCWILVGTLLLILAALMLEARNQVTLALSQYARIPADFGLLLILFLSFAPVTTCFLLGQDSMLMLLIYTLVFVLLLSARDFWAGCILACGLFKFQLILPFAAILLLRRRWSAVAGFAAVGSLLVLVSIAISGYRVLIEYPKLLFVNRAYQQVGGFDPAFMPNVRGFLYLLGGRQLPASVFALGVAIVSLFLVWFAARNWRDEQLGLSFSLCVFAALLASYHLYNYDLSLLLLPISIVCGEHAKQNRLLCAPVMFTAALIVLFVPPVHYLLLRWSLYALMFIPIAILFWHVISLLRRPPMPQTRGIVETADV
jgi:Glycosyltransferase family 87